MVIRKRRLYVINNFSKQCHPECVWHWLSWKLQDNDFGTLYQFSVMNSLKRIRKTTLKVPSFKYLSYFPENTMTNQFQPTQNDYDIWVQLLWPIINLRAYSEIDHDKASVRQYTFTDTVLYQVTHLTRRQSYTSPCASDATPEVMDKLGRHLTSEKNQQTTNPLHIYRNGLCMAQCPYVTLRLLDAYEGKW